MKLLLTGFDPFGGEAVNPSWEAVKEVSLPGDVELMKLQVPVVFGEAARTVLEAVRKHRPDAVVCVGQAGGRDKITPERVAVNVMDARICDNAGKQPVDCPVVSDGPAAYFSTLPIKKMAAAMEEAGVGAAVSNTAGTFVCNSLMYELLHFLATEKLGILAGFIHVPYLPEQTAGMETPQPSMPLGQITRGLAAALRVLTE